MPGLKLEVFWKIRFHADPPRRALNFAGAIAEVWIEYGRSPNSGRGLGVGSPPQAEAAAGEPGEVAGNDVRARALLGGHLCLHRAAVGRPGGRRRVAPGAD